MCMRLCTRTTPFFFLSLFHVHFSLYFPFFCSLLHSLLYTRNSPFDNFFCFFFWILFICRCCYCSILYLFGIQHHHIWCVNSNRSFEFLIVQSLLLLSTRHIYKHMTRARYFDALSDKMCSRVNDLISSIFFFHSIHLFLTQYRWLFFSS